MRGLVDSRYLCCLIALLVCLWTTAADKAKQPVKQLSCFPGASTVTETAQAVRIECGGSIMPGKSAVATYNWGDLLDSSTILRYSVMQVNPMPDSIGEGDSRISLYGDFVRDGKKVPTCQTKRRLAVTYKYDTKVEFVPKQAIYNGYAYGGAQYAAISTVDTKSTNNKFDEWKGPADGDHADQCSARIGHDNADGSNKKRSPTPQTLRVLVKCQSAPSKRPSRGSCAVRLGFTVVFTGGIKQPVQVTDPENLSNPSVAADKLIREQSYTCHNLNYTDTLNVLNTEQLNAGESDQAATQLCFPPPPSNPSGDMMPAGAQWDEVTLARAVRFSRYASTIHGCLPGQSYDAGTRTWADVAAWGGPTPSAVCNSCFKDGINYGSELGGPPFGEQTANILFESFEDAAMVFTDTHVDPEAPAIVVLFRATVSDLNLWQWYSNIGQCILDADNMSPVTDSTGKVYPAAGKVCSGWYDNVGLLYSGLLANIKSRIVALSENGTTASRIFVTGHSRGGALAAAMAARLVVEQEAGNLGVYNGTLGNRAQISLYTFGAPRVGDPTFASFLEQHMYERFRSINRFDPITSGPLSIQGYKHWRPAVWWRDPHGNANSNEKKYCVLAPQLSSTVQQCLVSCNSALICSNVPATEQELINGTLVPASAACQELIDATFDGFITQIIRGGLEGHVRDHGTYYGVDVDNSQCAVDQSVYASFANCTTS